MRLDKSGSLVMCLCAGAACSVAVAGQEPAMVIDPGVAQGVHRVYLYYNMATGERIATLPGRPGQPGPRSAGSESEPVWLSLTGDLCHDAGVGYTTSFFFAFEDGASSVIDWGDVAKDTVVDCVHIGWITSYADSDSNSDGFGDGVVGLGAQWTIYDAYNGRAIDSSTRLPLLSFLFTDLPGNVFGDGAFTSYSVDIDLESSFTSDVSFEIGDSDGDLQGAAFGNTDVDTDGDGIGDGVSVSNADRNHDGLPDSDLDGDGLFDWAYEVRYFAPGSTDFDGDGAPDGDPSAEGLFGMVLASPEGTLVDHGDGSWGWDIDTTAPGAGFGSEDMFVIDGLRTNFGGFSCSPGDSGQYTPRADIAMGLYSRSNGECCPADLNCDGHVDLFELIEYVHCGPGGDPILCDYNGDGVVNYFDISDLLRDLRDAGCF